MKSGLALKSLMVDNESLLEAIEYFKPDDMPSLTAALNIIKNHAKTIREYEDQRRAALKAAKELVAILEKMP